MSFLIAISIKSIVIIVSIVGLCLGLFPDNGIIQDKQAEPEITNEWTALAVTTDNDNVLRAVQVHQKTAQIESDNNTRVKLYKAYNATSRKNMCDVYDVLTWFIVGSLAVMFPLPKRKEITKK